MFLPCYGRSSLKLGSPADQLQKILDRIAKECLRTTIVHLYLSECVIDRNILIMLLRVLHHDAVTNSKGCAESGKDNGIIEKCKLGMVTFINTNEVFGSDFISYHSRNLVGCSST